MAKHMLFLVTIKIIIYILSAAKNEHSAFLKKNLGRNSVRCKPDRNIWPFGLKPRVRVFQI